MYRDLKLKDVIPGCVYWIKIKRAASSAGQKPYRWALVTFMENDYSDGTVQYFFDVLNHIKIFGFDKIERVVEVNEPADAD